ncbi:thiamine diphosphokinase [Aminivibrio sp.]|uniref:thiamine diphosphokinase n=1 Tax=Aminivibrio sp. TaxID=1872489 RepID=UPI001A3AC476|nr:thiamine diphosphokinase [Aminivibrio sp.]MBL3538936.1 thiamine diphosphokinase [Aminivibrio sp.]
MTDVGEIVLPGVRAAVSADVSREPLVIVAGGREPSPQWLREFLPGKEVWCADSGLVPCMKAGFTPSRLLGDGDSTPPDLWEQVASAGTTVVESFPADKDFTDLQLAFFRAAGEGQRTVIVSGCWGGRFDHLWSAVHSALWAAERRVRVLAFADHLEVLFLVHGGEKWQLDVTDERYSVLSLLPLGGECGGVFLEGTKWTLDDAELVPWQPFAVSNRLVEKEKPGISVRKGILGVYLGSGEKAG